MGERHGKNARVIIGASIIKLTEINISRTMDKSEVQGFGDSNKRYVVGFKDVSGSFSGKWDDATDSLFDTVDAAVPVNMYIYPDFTNAPTQYFFGSAYVDDGVSMSVSDAVTISGSFSAAGNWGRNGLP